MNRRLTLLCFLTVISFLLRAQTEEPKTSWEKGPLETHFGDSIPITKMLEAVGSGETKIHSILLLKNNQLLLEEYYQEYDLNKVHDLRSSSKSIRSLLMGIAVDQGLVRNIDDPVYKYLPNLRPQKNQDERKGAITIRHLLTMSTGLECNDWDPKSKGQEDRVYKKKDWLQYTIDLPMANDPGEVSAYCSMGAILVAEIISVTSGMSIQEFAQKNLFDPLGIKQVQWGHTNQKEVIDSGKRLYMRPRDMAKLGQLVLQQGQWEGKQIVSKVWIEEATTPKTKITGIDYGYLWWNLPFQYQGRAIQCKLATGNGGQYIMVFPDLELVAVFTGGAYNSQDDKLPFALMNRVILPSLKD